MQNGGVRVISTDAGYSRLGVSIGKPNLTPEILCSTFCCLQILGILGMPERRSINLLAYPLHIDVLRTEWSEPCY